MTEKDLKGIETDVLEDWSIELGIRDADYMKIYLKDIEEELLTRKDRLLNLRWIIQ